MKKITIIGSRDISTDMVAKIAKELGCETVLVGSVTEATRSVRKQENLLAFVVEDISQGSWFNRFVGTRKMIQVLRQRFGKPVYYIGHLLPETVTKRDGAIKTPPMILHRLLAVQQM